MNVTIRESSRAKKMFIQVTPVGQVELVIPNGKSKQIAMDFAVSQLPWIQKTVKNICNERTKIHGLQKDFPDKLNFRSVSQEWSIGNTVSQNRISVHKNSTQRILTVGAPDSEYAINALNNWIKEQAKLIFTPWLKKISNELGIPYNRISIRNQKTRWGSCSANRNININQKLLFLPSYLVRYVLIHELCHIRVLNHSRMFWDLVMQFDPEYLAHELDLKNANIYVPDWTYK